VLLMLAIACGPQLEPPELTFLAPAVDESISGDEVSFSLLVDHFVLGEEEEAASLRAPLPMPMLMWVPTARAHDVEGTPSGYLWVELDSDGQQLEVTTGSFTAVAAGEHTLSAELFFHDGDALEPPVTASVTFTTE